MDEVKTELTESLEAREVLKKENPRAYLGVLCIYVLPFSPTCQRVIWTLPALCCIWLTKITFWIHMLYTYREIKGCTPLHIKEYSAAVP